LQLFPDQPVINFKPSQVGVALIEMLVALVIGVVVVGAVLATYLSSVQSGRLQSAYAQMDEDAQIGLHILSSELRMAGYAQPVSKHSETSKLTKTYNARPVFGCDRGFQTAAHNTPAECGGSVKSPAIEIAYEADLYNTVVTQGKPSDCLGNSFQDGQTGITYNRYRANSNALQCTGPRGNAAPLVPNVERLQFWYGEADSANPRKLVRYVKASEVQDFDLVLSVRVCLLIRSARAVIAPEDGTLKSYLDCEMEPQESSDRHLRRAYVGTTALRNRMPF
jgi:type IV pilus assembly protein PilW